MVRFLAIAFITKSVVVGKKYYNEIPSDFFSEHYVIAHKYFYSTVQELAKNAAETAKVYLLLNLLFYQLFIIAT